MVTRRHRGWVITRSVYYPGDYKARKGDEVREWPAKWGIAGVKADLDALAEDEVRAEREAEQRAEARRRRDAEDAERQRLWLGRLPSTSCPKCGAAVVTAVTEQGHRIPLDAQPNPDGDWAVVACQVRGRVPVVLRTSEPFADRYEVHSSVCSARPAMAEPSGQLRLRFRKSLIQRKPRRRRPPANRQMFLTLSHHAEQLDLPCPSSASPSASPAAPESSGP